MIMVSIKESLTFDDVTLAPRYSEILPSETDTSVTLTKYLKLKIPLLSSAMDTVTESKMAIALAKAGGIGVIHRNLDIKKQILEIKKVKKQKLLVGAAVGAGPKELIRAKSIIKEGVDLIVVDTAHGHTKKVSEIIKFINHCKSFENKDGYLTQSFFKKIILKKAQFVSGPFTNMIFEILEKQKNKLKIIVGNVVMTVSDNSNYLYRPA